MNRIFIIALVAIFAAMTDTSRGASGTFSGRVWNDINRDGIQDVDEPPMTNLPISIISASAGYYGYYTSCLFAVYYTDSDGHYNFSYSNANGTCMSPLDTNINYAFFVGFEISESYSMSTNNAGTNDAIDSDFAWFPGHIVTNDTVDYANRDLGIFRLIAAVSFEMQVNGVPIGTPLYVTNGTPLMLTYQVQNMGDTPLSYVMLYDTDPLIIDQIELLSCPANIGPMEILSYSTQHIVHVSFTNDSGAIAVPINYSTCNNLVGFDPVWDSAQAIVIVVTNLLDHADGDIFPNWWEMQYGFDPLNSNAPSVNSDSDWMSNYEEFIAGTNPTNGASYFSNAGLTEDYLLMVTPSITNRVYNIWRSTNLLGEPQEWSLYPPEQTGTGSAVLFTIPVDDPAAQFRTGVRLP